MRFQLLYNVFHGEFHLVWTSKTKGTYKLKSIEVLRSGWGVLATLGGIGLQVWELENGEVVESNDLCHKENSDQKDENEGK